MKNKILLQQAPLDDIADEGWNYSVHHYAFLKFVLSVSNKSLSNIFALTDDNASTDRAISRLAGTIFIDCHFHCFRAQFRRHRFVSLLQYDLYS